MANCMSVRFLSRSFAQSLARFLACSPASCCSLARLVSCSPLARSITRSLSRSFACSSLAHMLACSISFYRLLSPLLCQISAPLGLSRCLVRFSISCYLPVFLTFSDSTGAQMRASAAVTSHTRARAAARAARLASRCHHTISPHQNPRQILGMQILPPTGRTRDSDDRIVSSPLAASHRLGVQTQQRKRWRERECGRSRGARARGGGKVRGRCMVTYRAFDR